MSQLAGKMRGMEGLQTYNGHRKLENKPYGSPYKVDHHLADPSRPARTSSSPTWKNKNYSYNSSWSFNDPEVKRQRRVVKYKTYAVEGKLKSTFRNGFCWVKNKYRQIMHGY